MRLMIPRSKDFWAGLLFIAFGALAIIVARNYPFGTASQMNAGFFPTILGGLLCVLGFGIAVRALATDGERIGAAGLRPFLVLVGVACFAILLPVAGLVIATVVLLLVSALGAYDAKWREVALTTVVLTVLAVVVFAWGLGLPFTIWPRF